MAPILVTIPCDVTKGTGQWPFPLQQYKQCLIPSRKRESILFATQLCDWRSVKDGRNSKMLAFQDRIWGKSREKKVKARKEVVPKQICKIPALLCDALRQCGRRVAQTGRNICCSFASLLSRWHKNRLSAFNDCGSVGLSGLSSWQTPRADVRGPESFLLFFFSFFPPSSVSNEQFKLSKMSAATWRSKTASECEPQPVNAFGLWCGLKRSGEPRLSVSSIFSPLHAWNACGQETELIEIWYVTKVCFLRPLRPPTVTSFLQKTFWN